jgi:anthranilate phosphoribosyltransferase
MSGAADVLEALKINIHQDPAKVRTLLEDVGICFLFAQDYHSSMKYVGEIRKELGIKTVFNILGPLTNPAHPTYQVMGVYSPTLLEPLARVLTNLGVKKGMVVYGDDKMDEISISHTTSVCEFCGDKYETYKISPGDFGIKRAFKQDIEGGTAQKNAFITMDILSGKTGPKRDIVLMNSAAGLYCSGKASSLADGVELAAKLIDDGSAMRVLDNYKVASNQ